MEDPRIRTQRIAGMLPWVVLFGGLITTFVVVLDLNAGLASRAEHHLTDIAASSRYRIEQDLIDALELIRASEGFFDASDEVTRREFDRFMERFPLLGNAPAPISVVWSPVVPASELDAFVKRQRVDEQYPWFHVAERADAREYVVATYVYPHAQERGLMGYDAMADPERAAALVYARDTGDMSAILTPRLIQGVPGFVVYGPLYSGGSRPLTIPERQRLISGYLSIAFDLQKFIAFWGQELPLVRDGSMLIEFYDATPGTPATDTPLATAGNSALRQETSLRRTVVLPYANASLELRIWARPDIGLSRSDRLAPLIVGAALVLVTVGLFLLLTTNSRARKMAEQIASELAVTTLRQSQEMKHLNEQLKKELQSGTFEIREQVGELEHSRAAMLSLLEDLTAARDELEASRAYDQALLSSMADGVIAVDPDGRIRAVNEAALRLLGVTREHLQGQVLHDAIPLVTDDDARVPASDRPMSRALQATAYRVFSDSQHSYRRPDGSRIPVALDCAPIIQKGKLVGGIEVFRDITLERTIDRAKSEFVTLASHQLRTPLTAIAWYVELVLAEKPGSFSAEQLEYLREIQSANRRMINLVDALLNVSRLEMGSIAIDPKPVDVAVVVGNVLDDFVAILERRKVKLIRELDTSVGIVPLDQKLAEVVIQNIVSNAIKYTPAGGTVRVRLHAEPPWFVLTVEDTGIGIPREQQSRIFEKLFRADNAMKSDTDGTGLGMYIVKTIIEAINGKISFVSEEGAGSTFTVLFPLAGMPAKEGTRKLVGKTIE